MKTLYERLDKSVIEKIESDAVNYPALVEALLTALKHETVIMDLPIRHAARLHEYAHPYDFFNLTQYFDLFKSL